MAKAALLEEQLRSSKVHQEQLRDAMRAQHTQLADAQMFASPLRFPGASAVNSSQNIDNMHIYIYIYININIYIYIIIIY